MSNDSLSMSPNPHNVTMGYYAYYHVHRAHTYRSVALPSFHNAYPLSHSPKGFFAGCQVGANLHLDSITLADFGCLCSRQHDELQSAGNEQVQ